MDGDDEMEREKVIRAMCSNVQYENVCKTCAKSSHHTQSMRPGSMLRVARWLQMPLALL